MLVAEEVARVTGKKLDFKDWEGEKDGKPWCRDIRTLMKHRDSDADVSLALAEHALANEDAQNEEEKLTAQPASPSPPESKARTSKPKVSVVSSGYDSDDSLTGYASEPSSSRSPSPSPSELEEIEKDPTLRVGQTRITRPVYLAQLGEMVRPTSGVRSEEDQDEPRRVQVALDVAEELIRRKRGYGTELGGSLQYLEVAFRLIFT